MANVKAGCNIKVTNVEDRKRIGRKSWEASNRTAFQQNIMCSDDGTKSEKAGRRQSKSDSKASRSLSPESQEKMKTID